MTTASCRPTRHLLGRSRAVWPWLFSAALLGAMAGCADTSGLAPVASLRSAQALGVPLAGAGEALQVEWARDDWWKRYGDTRLNALVEKALADQPQLQAAAARVAKARAITDVADAALLPQVNAGVDLTRQKFTATGMYPAPVAGSVLNSGTAQFTLGWELDFFGKYRAALDAALGTARAAQADAQAARVMLAANVVRAYFQLGRLDGQAQIAQRVLALREEVQTLVRQRVQAGLDTRTELRQSDGSVAEARLQLQALQEQQQLARHALAALVGEPGVAASLTAVALPEAVALPAVHAVPADLLGRRADVVAARWRVEAALKDVEQARAQFYPNLNLMAFAGVSSLGLDRLLDNRSQQWGVGPALRLPVFDAGRLRANFKSRGADAELAIQSYHSTVLDAVRDVSDQITSLQSIAQQQGEQARAEQAADGAWALAVQRQEAGVGSRLQMLAALPAVLAQQRQALDLRARALDTQVALWRALGGGVPVAPASDGAAVPQRQGAASSSSSPADTVASEAVVVRQGAF